MRRPTRALLRASMRMAVRWIGGQFVFATDIETAIRRARRGPALWRYSFDMLGEAALTAADAERYLQAYAHAIRAAGAATAAAGVSVKLSALHPRYGYAQRGRILHELLPRLLELAHLAQRHGVPLTIDAEESDRLELSLDLIDALMRDAGLQDWPGLGVAVQAYQKRAPAVLDYLAALAAPRAHALRVRLVKGAYWDLEIKAAQVEGFSGYPVYTRKLHTDVAYLACARRILRDGRLSAQFATHNARTIADVLELAADVRPVDPLPTDAARADVARAGSARPLEFQCLYGMGGALYRHLARLPALHGGVAPTICVYAPVGERRDLLPYLMRRLLENGASSSFVHRATRASVSSLSADPVAAAARLGGARHADIREPGELFAPERRNSAGLDLESGQARARLGEALEQSRKSLLEVRAVLGAPAAPGSAHGSGHSYEIRNPADRAERIGVVHEADAGAIDSALAASVRAAREWGGTPAPRRAQLLEEAAARFEQHCPALIALIVREAGRTLADAIGEVREAIDALRYYAAQIRAQADRAAPESHVPQVPSVPLGTVLCISPWNFPLAIFTGQIGAALATGNAVLAKPAEQSTATASLAVRLLHEAGIPAAALQLLPGDGARVGMRMVADERVRGVLFTGSTATARAIARTLAGRSPVPLIAETGGQNAMIVDSSALPEQVVADAMRSAFDSAGQRCSSLRVLCLQEEIASPVLQMLQGAMQELCVGDPARLETDVGPLIDEPARERIEAHVQSLRERLLCRARLPACCERGVFVAPVLLRIDSIRELTREVFGPVLHVLRFRRERLSELIDDINATGYGLTLGIASRIPGTIEAITQRARVGNVYVNRNMIGAVIGAQPFGGQGLSGTGPKSGGPLYLQALLACSAGPQWPPRGASGQSRVGVPGALQELIDWLEGGSHLIGESEREWLRSRAEDYGRRTLLGARATLRGYVGESNELRLRARGRLRATARTLPALIEQLAAALATGNTLEVQPIGPAAMPVTTLLAALPQMLRGKLGIADGGADGGIGGPANSAQAVLVDAGDAAADTQWLDALRGALASREGPIVPVVIGHADRGYPLERLLVEQTVSINTAAVGGDVQLLSLREDDEGA